MVAIFIMAVKLATLRLLEIKRFQSKGYNVINSVYDVSNKFLWRRSN